MPTRQTPFSNGLCHLAKKQQQHACHLNHPTAPVFLFATIILVFHVSCCTPCASKALQGHDDCHRPQLRSHDVEPVATLGFFAFFLLSAAGSEPTALAELAASPGRFFLPDSAAPALSPPVPAASPSHPPSRGNTPLLSMRSVSNLSMNSGNTMWCSFW